MTTLADVLAAHRWCPAASHIPSGGCFGCAFHGDYAAFVTHQAEAVAAAGLAVIQLPEPVATEEDSDYGPTCVARWESTEIGEITAWPGGVVGVWDENHLDPQDARDLAAALLAAAAAAAEAATK